MKPKSRWLKDLMPQTSECGEVVAVENGVVTIEVTCPCCGKKFEITNKKRGESNE